MRVTNNLKFVVIGTGRCATAYTSYVFTEMGIPCGHEDIYYHHEKRPLHLATPVFGMDADRLLGDCSWSAIPFLDEFAGKVFHQRRDPLKVLGSWLREGLFSMPDTEIHAPTIEFIDRYFEREPDAFKTLMRWIVEWNERCEPYADLSWNIESLDAETLVEATDLIGHPKSIEECQAVLTKLPKNINHNGTTPNLTWEDLPEGSHKMRLQEMARRYGYSVPD